MELYFYTSYQKSIQKTYMGEFEQIVLLSLLRLDNDAYGMAAHEEIEDRTGREISIGALYRTLARLEAKGYVAHRMGEPTAERGGRAKKFFRVTGSGREALARTRHALDSMWRGIRVESESGE